MSETLEQSPDLKALPATIEREGEAAFNDVNEILNTGAQAQVVEVGAVRTGRFLRDIGVRGLIKKTGVREALINSPASAAYNLLVEVGVMGKRYPGRFPFERAIEKADASINTRIDEAGQEISG